jgi:TonB family protein
VQLSERRDARRLGSAIVVAIIVHAGLFVAIPYLTSLDTAPLPDYGPVVIRVELPEAVLEPPPPVAKPLSASQPAVKAAAKPAPAPKPAAKPAAKLAPVPKTAPSASTTAAPARAAGGSSFRQAGAAAGVSAGAAAASIVSGPPPVVLPPAGQASEQRAGVGESLTTHSTGGTLDKGKLDQSLAAAAAGGATGAAGTSGSTAAATGAKPGPGASLVWEDSAAGQGREYVKLPKVDLPKTAMDLVYEVHIEFTVNADGLVTPIKVVRSSGHTDVDKACLDAMRGARFSSARGAPDIKGTQIFTPEFGR